jgi:2'-hydroxyisoflavone reductase
MKLLVLGGTVFLGRHIVDAALKRGHTVTLFNRQQRNPSLFPGVEKLRGDRDGDMEALRGRKWDAVIDTCSFFPRLARKSADMLAGNVGAYALISTISVYADQSQPGLTETAALGKLADETVERVDGDTYGPLKALCERAVLDAMPNRALIIRPGLIVGPHDPTDRFTYWPARVAKGGEVLAPKPPDQPIQMIDARDLAEFTVRMVEAGRMDVFHCTGPDYPLTLETLLHVCRAEARSAAHFTWAAEEFLLRQNVGPWMELPLWIPNGTPLSGLLKINAGKALAAGLSFRPISQTVRETLEWDKTRPADLERRAGMKPERETEILAAWRACAG